MKTVSKLIEDVITATKLPEDIEWYNVDGKVVFPLATGHHCAYLIRKPKTKFERWFKYGIDFESILLYKDNSSRMTWARTIINVAISKFIEHLEKYPHVTGEKNLEFDPNGGSLGTGDNK